MAKSFEDCVIIGAVCFYAYLGAKKLYEAYEESQFAKQECSLKWNNWVDQRYLELFDKLDAQKATERQRVDAIVHLNMLVEKHLSFYVVNAIARKEALTHAATVFSKSN